VLLVVVKLVDYEELLIQSRAKRQDSVSYAKPVDKKPAGVV